MARPLHPRQLVALTTFSDLVAEARARVKRDAIVAGLPGDSTPLRDGGTGAKAYAEAVGVYLAFAVSKAERTHGPRSALGDPTKATRRHLRSVGKPSPWFGTCRSEPFGSLGGKAAWRRLGREGDSNFRSTLRADRTLQADAATQSILRTSLYLPTRLTTTTSATPTYRISSTSGCAVP